MPNDTPETPRFRIPAPPGQVSPPMPDVEEKLRAIMEEQGTAGKSRIEDVIAAAQGLFDSDEEYEQFLEILEQIRKTR